MVRLAVPGLGGGAGRPIAGVTFTGERQASGNRSNASYHLGTVTTVDADTALAFETLPSAQGWIYGAFGSTAPETSVFSVAGGVLTQTTMGLGDGGLNLYERLGIVDATKPFALTVTARVLGQEGDPTDAFGFAFGIATSTEQPAIGLRTDGIYDSLGNKLSGSIDTTQFHEYRLESTPEVGYRLFVDGVLLGSGPNVPRSTPTDPFVFLGDASGTSNASAEITGLSFMQHPGLVVAQQPAAGTSVPTGSAVDLTAVRDLATVTVPSVTGQPQDTAVATLVAARLLVGTIGTQPDPSLPAGRVISQTPLGETSTLEFTVVTLVVSTGPGTVSVPNVVGLEEAAARAAIATATLTVGVVSTAPSDTVPAGRVMSQDPLAGTKVLTGSAVGFVVSTGPETEPLASIRVTPIAQLILTGQTQAFAATGIRSNGSSLPLTTGLTWASTNPAVATIDAAGVASAFAEGTTTILVTQGSVTGSAVLNVAQSVTDTVLPVAQITSPADGANVTAAVPIVGTAGDANFLKYVLEIAPFESGIFATVAAGTVPVSNGTLGTLDPTTLVNDLYVVRLTVIDKADNRAWTEITVQVSREKKVGTFTLAFQDVTVPMAGIPISVVRSYDSRDKRKGDFGIGWRLDVQTARLRVTGVEGQGWYQQTSGGLFPTYRIEPTRTHKLAITLPDGTVEEFDFTVSPTQQPFVPIMLVTPSYAPRPLTRGTLRAVGQEDLAVLGAVPGEIEFALESDPTTPFQPTAYEYTTPEGQTIPFQRAGSTGTVTRIADRNGNTVAFGPTGIIHSAGKSVSFTRDGQGRITAVTDPMGHVQTCTYDVNGDLSSHADAQGNHTTFLYNYDHGLIEIRDPRGLRPIRNEYDEAGRLVSTTDAFGKTITYTHDLGANREVITDRLGHTTTHVYDDLGNVTQTAVPGLGGGSEGAPGVR